MIRVGMSGFAYPTWVGHVYPEGTARARLLQAYAKRFDTVEINVTFRRRQDERTYLRWREATPETFRFALKAHQHITHRRRLVGVGDDVEAFVEGARSLGSRLGPILFQTPPTLVFLPEVLEAFCRTLAPGGEYAFEGRHPSFRTPQARRILERHGVARCLDDAFEDPAPVPGPLAYFRFRRLNYTSEELARLADIVRGSDAGQAYVFFAHSADPHSADLAMAFRALMASGG